MCVLSCGVGWFLVPFLFRNRNSCDNSELFVVLSSCSRMNLGSFKDVFSVLECGDGGHKVLVRVVAAKWRQPAVFHDNSRISS